MDHHKVDKGGKQAAENEDLGGSIATIADLPPSA